jgi:hypothetical protein
MTEPPLACTIVANNYLAYARVFARSVRDRLTPARVARHGNRRTPWTWIG